MTTIHLVRTVIEHLAEIERTGDRHALDRAGSLLIGAATYAHKRGPKAALAVLAEIEADHQRWRDRMGTLAT